MTTFEKAVKRYNDLMYEVGEDYNTIGTNSTENDGGYERDKWNLRDLVSEVQYLSDKYHDRGCVYLEEAEFDSNYRKEWRRLTAKMKRFIDAYKEEALTMECVNTHCSKWD